MRSLFKKHDVDYMIETLSSCQILPLKYLKRLCEKVERFLFRLKKFFSLRLTLFRFKLLSKFAEISMASSQIYSKF